MENQYVEVTQDKKNKQEKSSDSGFSSFILGFFIAAILVTLIFSYESGEEKSVDTESKKQEMLRYFKMKAYLTEAILNESPDEILVSEMTKLCDIMGSRKFKESGLSDVSEMKTTMESIVGLIRKCFGKDHNDPFVTSAIPKITELSDRFNRLEFEWTKREKLDIPYWRIYNNFPESCSNARKDWASKNKSEDFGGSRNYSENSGRGVVRGINDGMNSRKSKIRFRRR